MNWESKNVVVTGASSGVGRAVVREFARHGANLGLIARGMDGLQGTQAEVEQAGGRAVIAQTDVADADQVEQAAERIEQELGPIDVWVNNAMTTVFSPLRDITPAEFRRATEVTYLGTVYGTMSALRRMSRRNRGTIVQVGSALAYRAIPLQAPYCGAKHAVRGFTDSLRSELLHEGQNIGLTMVQLPALNTPQFSWCRTRLPNHPQPVPPIFQPEVAARGIVWAAEHCPRELNVGWTTSLTINGNKLLPGYGDHYLAKNGWEGQQTGDPVDPDRPSNLFEPVPGDHGAHGVFDPRATDHSPQQWLTRNGTSIGLTMAASALVATGLTLLFRRSI